MTSLEGPITKQELTRILNSPGHKHIKHQLWLLFTTSLIATLAELAQVITSIAWGYRVLLSQRFLLPPFLVLLAIALVPNVVYPIFLMHSFRTFADPAELLMDFGKLEAGNVAAAVLLFFVYTKLAWVADMGTFTLGW